MRNIVFRGKDDSVAIMTLAEGASKEDAIKKFMDCHGGFYIDYVEEVSAFPANREFRDAWTLSNDRVVVDKDKAKEIHLNRIRTARDKELEKLDKEQLKNLSNPDKIQEIEDKKQVLRDLPANVKSLEWPKELK